MNNFAKLASYVRDTNSLGYLGQILEWDQSTYMPSSAVEQRADSLGALESIIHKRKKSPLIGDLLADVDEDKLNPVEKAQLRQIKRSYDRANKIPEELSRAIVETTTKAEMVWRQAMSDNDYQSFKPELKKIINLKREEGQILSPKGNPYDGLLNDYEVGMTCEHLDVLFGELKPGLNNLRERILAKPPLSQPPKFKYSKNKQIKLAKELAKRFGYHLDEGRVDLVTHPFCVGSGRDVRITTRIDKYDPFNCLYSTIHESGHGAYEQNIGREYCLTSIGLGSSFGVHESQSRICENQLGRSKAFTGWLYQKMKHTFGDIGISSKTEFYHWANQVKKGFKRTEADEVQYNLHIILRYELEKNLLARDLEVDDLKEAWNEKFLDYFGYPVEKPSQGILQDVHWSLGLFGYFPTYALGNVYAGCLYDTIQNEIKDLDRSLAQGDITPATSWLCNNIHQYGALRDPKETIEKATGKPIRSTYLLEYLENKFTEIYSL